VFAFKGLTSAEGVQFFCEGVAKVLFVGAFAKVHFVRAFAAHTQYRWLSYITYYITYYKSC